MESATLAKYPSFRKNKDSGKDIVSRLRKKKYKQLKFKLTGSESRFLDDLFSVDDKDINIDKSNICYRQRNICRNIRKNCIRSNNDDPGGGDA